MNYRKIYNLHPILFGIFPVLSLFSFNISLVIINGLTELYMLVLAAAIFALIIWIIFSFILKNSIKGSVLASFILIMIFFFGHLQSQIGERFLSEIQFFIVWINLLAIGIYGINRIKRDFSTISTILFFISITLIFLPIIEITNYQIETFSADLTTQELLEKNNSQTEISNSDMISWIKFDETVQDHISNNDGSWLGLEKYNQLPHSYVGLFDGSSKILLSNEENYDTTKNEPFTVSAWVYFPSDGNPDGFVTFVSKQDANKKNPGWIFWFQHDKDTKERVGCTITDSEKEIFGRSSSSGSVPHNTWAHVVCRYNGNADRNGIDVFVNGTIYSSSKSKIISGTITNDIQIAIGAESDGTNTVFNGTQIDDVKFWTKALSDEEIIDEFGGSFSKTKKSEMNIVEDSKNSENLVSQNGFSIGTKPDIYYFIFDRYGSPQTLNDVFNYDNKEFLNYLENTGFYIAYDSKGNYQKTPQSLASSLNMNYHNFLTADVGPDASRTAIYKQIDQCDACQFLKSQGYKYLLFGSWYQPTKTSTNADIVIEYNKGLSDFTTLLLGTTIASPFIYELLLDVEEFDEDAPTDKVEQYERILYKFEKLKEVPNLEEPTFVFSHFLVPHVPYVFDDKGEYLTLEKSRELRPKEKYLAQITSLNEKIIQLVEDLISKSKDPPIIIIQSDEGPSLRRHYVQGTKIFQWDSINYDELNAKLRILNAYYLPNVDQTKFYPSISPVNSFRLIFNSYFDTNYPPLDDIHYVYQNVTHFYQYVDVTERFENVSWKNIDFENDYYEKFDWEKIGVDESAIKDHPHLTELLNVYYQRDDLQTSFPEVKEGELSYLFDWASYYGVNYYPNLSKYQYIYDLFFIFNNPKSTILETDFPQATNGVNLSEVYCWAKNQATKEVPEPILAQHASIYENLCS